MHETKEGLTKRLGMFFDGGWDGGALQEPKPSVAHILANRVDDESSSHQPLAYSHRIDSEQQCLGPIDLPVAS
jgi:hypothetical protein